MFGLDFTIKSNSKPVRTEISISTFCLAGKKNSEDVSHALSAEQCVEGKRDGEVSVHSCPDLLSNAVRPIQQELSTASEHQVQPVPKSLERTLKLVA